MKAQIRADLTTAMKAKDEVTKSTLRMVLSALTAAETSGTSVSELTDDEILKILAKEAKKRAEAADVFTANGREELAAKERAEGEVIARYLPAQLDDAELTAIVGSAYAQVEQEVGEPPTMRQMGQIMKVASARVAGRADGSRVSAAVKARLG